jgi:hypothetical protein
MIWACLTVKFFFYGAACIWVPQLLFFGTMNSSVNAPQNLRMSLCHLLLKSMTGDTHPSLTIQVFVNSFYRSRMERVDILASGY